MDYRELVGEKRREAAPDGGGFVLGGLARRPVVKVFAGIAADSTLYEWIAKGLFPKPIKIGPRASAWLVDELLEWKASRVAERGSSVGTYATVPTANPSQMSGTSAAAA